MSALDKLIEAVEAGTADHSDFAAMFPYPICDHAGEAHHGSLDAALALHEALLPGWSKLLHGGHHGVADYGMQVEKVQRDNTRIRGNGLASTPARAWLLAILRAYRTQQEPT